VQTLLKWMHSEASVYVEDLDIPQNKLSESAQRILDRAIEILCHRERANSVMLLGEPGVGKTVSEYQDGAIAVDKLIGMPRGIVGSQRGGTITKFASAGTAVEHVQADVKHELERRFPPEFLNRIDEVVLFSPLTHDEPRRIAKRYLGHVHVTLAKSEKAMEIDDDALELIVTQGHSLAFGARFLKRVIDERIKLPISAHWQDNSRFHVRAKGSDVVVDVVQEYQTSESPSLYEQVG
jgi:ATP-dependent Clp protease ATP-binding subunit ClpA